MNKTILAAATAFTAAVLYGCAAAPVTGRRQLTLIPGGALSMLADSWYREEISASNISEDRELTERLERGGQNTAEAAEKFMIESGRGSEVKNYRWEFNLIEDDTINAWAMPGGKIAFYTGILEIMDSDDEIAVVMGHEIAHVIARHGNERMSQHIVMGFGMIGLDRLLKDKPEETREIFLAAFGLGSHIGIILPYSRRHEYEADEIGLNLMVKAGYDPMAAVRFWNKMDAMGGGSAPEFLSTHPTSLKRSVNLRRLVAEMRLKNQESGSLP